MSIKNLTWEKEEIQSLISDISHQAVTPISNIILYFQLLEESASGGREEILAIREQKVEPLLMTVKHQYRQKAEQKGISLIFEDSKETAVFDLKCHGSETLEKRVCDIDML